MLEEKSHDLHDFMQQLSNEMAAEYDRIQKRATEDPGTAGDQGEENWAELLRGWLPRTYEVVTKGRIISQDGLTSPQVDVLVLKSIYPEKLLNKKLYLAAGVAAAFECKTTLTAAHIAEAMETCVKIKNLYPVRTGTPYKELHAPIVYGLLAHSHSWKSANSTPETNIAQKLRESDASHVLHPRQTLDLLCVANLGTWFSGKITVIDLLHSVYFGHTPSHYDQTEFFTPIGTLISGLSRRLAWEDSSLRSLADYYQNTRISGHSEGNSRVWNLSIYSENVQRCLQGGGVGVSSNVMPGWDEWQSGHNVLY